MQAVPLSFMQYPHVDIIRVNVSTNVHYNSSEILINISKCYCEQSHFSYLYNYDITALDATPCALADLNGNHVFHLVKFSARRLQHAKIYLRMYIIRSDHRKVRLPGQYGRSQLAVKTACNM